MTDRLPARDSFVIHLLDTDVRTAPIIEHFREDIAMIINAQHPVARDAYQASGTDTLLDPVTLDGFEQDYADTDGEILRMIEMSGMISLDCSLLQDA